MKYVIVFVLLMHNAQAMVNSVYCEYNFGNNKLVTSLKKDKNSLMNLTTDDMQTTVFIKDVDDLSEADDYINFKKDGKNIIFSLKCRKL